LSTAAKRRKAAPAVIVLVTDEVTIRARACT